MSDESERGHSAKSVVALCGGVGGAKLALGLQRLLGAALTVVVNVGDDFDHMGLRVCPDLDTVLYTLGGLSDEQRGWGRSGETWNFMEAVKQLGGPSWFALGDRDLALHVERTRRLADGESLSAVIAAISARLNIAARILPVTDDELRTKVETEQGVLAFQRYFVERRCEPAIRRILFEGAEAARLSPAVIEALRAPGLSAVVLCPSNPYLSVDPILAAPGLKDELLRLQAPIVAVSPLIGGRAIKGPTAKIMAELGIETNTASIAAHYRDLIDGLIVDEADASEAAGLTTPTRCVSTLMVDLPSRIALARETLAFAASLASS